MEQIKKPLNHEAQAQNQPEQDYESILQSLQNKVGIIAEKYADLVDRQLESALSKSEADKIEITEINDGIRILHHVAAALERIERLQIISRH